MARQKGFYSDFDHLTEHLEQMWGRLTTGTPRGPRFAPPVIEPPTDVYQTEDAILVLMEIAGMRDEEVEIQLEGREMVVRGEKRDRRQHSPERVYNVVEIAYGPFERRITLPADVDYERVTVQYDDGLLQITLPKRAFKPERRVRITVR
jgi:HSP20 family protein